MPNPSSPIARADYWVKQRFPRLSRRLIGEAFKSRLITGPHGQRLGKGSRIEADQLDFKKLEKFLVDIRMGRKLDIPILFESPEFFVIDKPAGIPSLPVHLKDEQTVTQWAFERFPELRAAFPEIQPTLCPHRLDTGTSGLLIVARNKQAFEQWRRRFSKKQITKTYLAWCWNIPEKDAWVIDLPIGHSAGNRAKMHVFGDDASTLGLGREAQTGITVVKRLEDRCLVQAKARTGVTHQIRVHLASAGFPLIGDKDYDPAFASRPHQGTPHLLRAFRLTAEDFSFDAPTADFEELFRPKA